MKYWMSFFDGFNAMGAIANLLLFFMTGLWLNLIVAFICAVVSAIGIFTRSRDD